MPEYLSPGVYVEEVAAGPVPIAGVSTSTGAMIGLTQRGPVNVPTLVTSAGDFRRTFGSALRADAAPKLNAGFNAVAYAVEGFFANGGRRLYVTRVAPADLTPYKVEYALQGVPVISAPAALPSGAFTASGNTGPAERPNVSFRVTYVYDDGHESAASKATQFTIPATNFVQVASPAPATGASSYNLYAGAAGNETLQTIKPLTLGTGFDETTSPLTTTGRAVPAFGAIGAIVVQAIDGGSWANPRSGVVRSQYRQTDGLQLAFAMEPTIEHVVAAGTSTTSFTVSSAFGLYVGAVINITVEHVPQYTAITAIADKTITVAPALTGTPDDGDTFKVQEFSLAVSLLENGGVVASETWHNLTANRDLGSCIVNVIGEIPKSPDGRTTGASNLIRAALPALNFDPAAPVAVTPATGPVANASPSKSTLGDDALTNLAEATYNDLFNAGALDAVDPADRKGIYAFKNVRGLLMIAMPGMTAAQAQADLVALCQNEKYKFAIIDPVGKSSPLEWHEIDATPAQVQTQRASFDTEYGALYYPWIVVEDPAPKNPSAPGTVHLPPSGHVMGIYARSDVERGVHKAPANEVVNGALAFSHVIDTGTQDILNPLGINVLRDFRAENRGLRVWGARTMSSHQDWKYVSIRRLFQYVEASIDYGTQWVVFEPNNELLWARVRHSVSDFLTDTWRTGALMGTKASEAFYVVCDRTTMTESDLENGRLIVEIGIAPTFPAEFVIFHISQWTGSAQKG